MCFTEIPKDLLSTEKGLAPLKIWQNYLFHGFIIWLILRVGPINNDVALPDLGPAVGQLPLGCGSILVTVVLQESKPSVLQLRVVSRTVHYNFLQTLWRKYNTQLVINTNYFFFFFLSKNACATQQNGNRKRTSMYISSGRHLRLSKIIRTLIYLQ